MKSTLLSQVRTMPTLGRAWHVIYENGRSSQSSETRRDTSRFAETAEASLNRIQRQLSKNAFAFEPATGVSIQKKGKHAKRPLVVAPIESRIVQRAIHDVLLSIPAIQRYAENPYSFGGVRKKLGTDIAGVPAAIETVLRAIGAGARYAIRSDISSFFTMIPKPVVTQIVADATQDPDFVALFKKAITVELKNLAELAADADLFPLYEIGVAQGCSLSPLLGNLLLSDFDQQMNSGVCTCLRYVDDFIILAPNNIDAEKQFSLAVRLLKTHGLRTSGEKTLKGYISNGLEFLGIEINNGAIRPSRDSRKRLINKVQKAMQSSIVGFYEHEKSGQLSPRLSLIRTLTQASGIVQGWGKQYYFCNDKNLLGQLDSQLDSMIRQYLGIYAKVSKPSGQTHRRRLLGIPLLEELASKPFKWPESTPQPGRMEAKSEHAHEESGVGRVAQP
jgi:retron-type reverse transcriptase